MDHSLSLLLVVVASNGQIYLLNRVGSLPNRHGAGGHGALAIYIVHLVAEKFQFNLIKTMMQIEQTYFDLAEMCSTNCLVICDRGVMDPSACTLLPYLPLCVCVCIHVRHINEGELNRYTAKCTYSI